MQEKKRVSVSQPNGRITCGYGAQRNGRDKNGNPVKRRRRKRPDGRVLSVSEPIETKLSMTNKLADDTRDLRNEVSCSAGILPARVAAVAAAYARFHNSSGPVFILGLPPFIRSALETRRYLLGRRGRLGYTEARSILRELASWIRRSTRPVCPVV